MTAQSKFDIVTVGHFAIDTIGSPRIAPARTTLGGPPTYVSVAASKLGAKVSVISKVGEDFSSEYRAWLQKNHVDLSGVRQVNDDVTTQFVLKYQDHEKRRLRLKSRAPEISASDIPTSLQAKVIHVAPIANELSTAVVARLRKTACKLSLDPQGFVRDFDSHGYVHLKRWIHSSVLELVDIYKSSLEEMRVVTGVTEVKQAIRKIQDYGAEIVIATRGLQGSTLLFDNAFYDVPACKPKVVRDPTGAGDAYLGAFLAEYVKGEDPLWSACVGSASASFVVEGIGPERFGSRQETYERARRIYQKQHTEDEGIRWCKGFGTCG